MTKRTKPSGGSGLIPMLLLVALVYLIIRTVAGSLGDSQVRRLINPPAEPTITLPGAVIPSPVPTINPAWPWERDAMYGEAITYWQDGTHYLVVQFSEENKKFTVNGEEKEAFSQTVFIRGNIEMIEHYSALNATTIADEHGTILFFTRFDFPIDGKAGRVHVIANVGAFEP